jgi:hypothetical protein
MLDFLKTIPDMTNTPEITMQEETPKISMSARIRNYKAANPDANAKQIADAVGTSTVYVYQILSNPPKKTKRGGAVAEKTPLEKPAVSLKEFEDLKKALANSIENNLGYEEEVTGLKAVIKYLEEKLEEATF